jgi:hypothetical protein
MSAIEIIADRIRQAILSCHPLLARLNAIRNVRSFSGGRTIIEELQFPHKHLPELLLPEYFDQTKDVPFIWYSGYQPIDPEKKGYQAFPQHGEEVGTVFTASEYPIRQLAIAFADSSKIDPDSDFVATTIKNFQNSFSHSVMWHVGQNSIHSLDQFVSSRPTVDVIGGIDRHQWKFWRNLALTIDAKVNMLEAMELMYGRLLLVEGKNKVIHPDLILMGQEDFDIYKNSLPEEKRIADPEYEALGFKSIMFRQATVVLDRTIGPAIDNYVIRSPRIYFLHTKYFRFRFHENRNFCVLNADSFDLQPDVRLIGWAGNLTASCLYAQGVLLRAP